MAQHNAYYAYLLVFFMLWIVWRQHHALFDQIGKRVELSSHPFDRRAAAESLKLYLGD